MNLIPPEGPPVSATINEGQKSTICESQPQNDAAGSTSLLDVRPGPSAPHYSYTYGTSPCKSVATRTAGTHTPVPAPPSPAISYVTDGFDDAEPGAFKGNRSFQGPPPPFASSQPYGASPYPDQPVTSSPTTQPYGASPYPDVVRDDHGKLPSNGTATTDRSTPSFSGGDANRTTASSKPSSSHSQDAENTAMDVDGMDQDVPERDHVDLLPRIRGMFRLLDLHSESGSGGLVDKIIIDKDSLKPFLDTVVPGAYKSVTKIDFAALDRILIKPIGIYGSKSEIVRFLLDAGAITDDVAVLLLRPDDISSHTQLRLRSGIYVLRPPASASFSPSSSESAVFIIYWPEDTTWDDAAIGTVRKNRVTFIRYLTRLADQIRVLISPEHSASLAWKENDLIDEDDVDDHFVFDLEVPEAEDDDSGGDRVFQFEVQKTNEQEEDAKVGPGYTLQHQELGLPDAKLNSSRGHLGPQLIAGEMGQGFVSARFVESSTKRKDLSGTRTAVALKSELSKYPAIVIADTVDDKGFQALLEKGGLSVRCDQLNRKYQQDARDQKDRRDREEKAAIDLSLKEVRDNADRLKTQAKAYLALKLLESYGMFDIESFIPNPQSQSGKTTIEDQNASAGSLDYFYHVVSAYPEVDKAVKSVLHEWDTKHIRNTDYAALRNKFLVVRGVQAERKDLSEAQTESLIGTILTDSPVSAAYSSSTHNTWGLRNFAKSAISRLGFNPDAADDEAKYHRHIERFQKEGDARILSSFAELTAHEPLFAEVSTRLHDLALVGLKEGLRMTADKLAKKMVQAQERSCSDQVKLATASKSRGTATTLFDEFRKNATKILGASSARSPLVITGVEPSRYYYGNQLINAYYDETSEPRIERRMRMLELTEHDKHQLKEDDRHVPSPRIRGQSDATFSFPTTWRLRHSQLLSTNKCLIIADTPNGLSLWLFTLHAGFSPLHPTRTIASVHGRRFEVAVDEQKKVVAFVIMEPGRCDVQLYAMDEGFVNVQSRGSPFSLMKWYQDGDPDIIAATFFCGSDELCLVEASGRVRVFSFLAQSFRPGAVQLPGRPLHVQSAPDGCALLLIERPTSGSRRILRVLHQASFGSSNGIIQELPSEFDTATTFSVTSLDNRGKPFVIAAVPSFQSIVSVSVDISKKETEYQFRMKNDSSQSNPSILTVHNSFIDCFADVWGRYPVVAAIQRNLISSETRVSPSVTFVCSIPGRQFQRYFKQMVRDFERVTRKPTYQRLDQIVVDAAPFDELEWDTTSSSLYKAGEWLTELFCLIPIHIAVARENRFVPLKDGVFDSAHERKLLGADVSSIIDSITLGWYESIFSSYMASKPVKVVSSMGEQSVGKSYSLNHLVDSSFAGSAVRTTEGVWLSVCPTKDFLVVALDFEGVHSIERTAQEDMLLVLFNTALSNLVLFRNNFALSRDVANMFTSFQASTHLFDPASNPKLFKGLLAIVIKDVVDGDKKEIVKEFSSKFYQIVTSERANNFISVLHNSQLTVIPWNVIQSREFYTLFTRLGKMLMLQKTTHTSAGEFLITLKTLMAKMKAQDWGSIDQTAIKHRVALLMAIIPAALSFGKDDEGDNSEDLKNLDNQDMIPHSDTNMVFNVQNDPSQNQQSLSRHVSSWHEGSGYDLDGLQAHLSQVADMRIQHVRDWLDANIGRFPADNADVRALRRAFDDNSQALRSNLQLCLAECANCRLRCVSHKAHDRTDHNCGTSHRCSNSCSFPEEHENAEDCGLPAGHEGRHICDGAVHLCGQPCHLDTKKGCQKRCALSPDHMEDEHVCSARFHQCGEPCSVRDMPVTHLRQDYSCAGLCSHPFDEEHTQHSCDNRLSCPIKCTLCQRYCTMGDHFHGFEAGALHLCGQEHGCVHDCEAAGICEINTTPHSVETTFTGQHDTFQYTKYTQVAKRLACAIVIPPDGLVHAGPHVHSEDADAFHYCEQACINCGYICTLPLGHRQNEHETAHGSMEQTAWAIEGKADTTVEIQGRTFGAQDGGAPQLCSSICRDIGRHAHIDYCRNVKGNCQEPESEHINENMLPNPSRPKDWVSHKVFWARSGFRDPYSKDEQAEFALCDVQCAGPEHQATATAPAHLSFCTLPIFHPPQPLSFQVAGNSSYVSNDGHAFDCPNPNNLRQAYHVIFVLDKSGSMTDVDRQPLANQPSTPLITQFNNNRFGAVLSAVYGFWLSRGSATTRRDSYSIITFDHGSQINIANDLTSTPDELLAQIVRVRADGGTHFDGALASAQTVMDTHWSTDRSPVVIFLSDGECDVSDNRIFDICNRAVAQGKPLSFHSVSFGSTMYSASLRRMVTIGEQVALGAPRDPLSPLVPCTYAEALDSIRLAETFLAIADSLKKPRASLIHS